MNPEAPAPSAPVQRMQPSAATDRPVVIVTLGAVFAAAILVTTLRHPHGIVTSADPGYAPVPLPLLLAPRS